jgi:hypothetical protein
VYTTIREYKKLVDSQLGKIIFLYLCTEREAVILNAKLRFVEMITENKFKSGTMYKEIKFIKEQNTEARIRIFLRFLSPIARL